MKIDSDWDKIHALIPELENAEFITRTFRRLDPERQRAVIEAILADAVENGPSNLNIKTVAERAGVALGSLYQYFGNRDGAVAFAMELTRLLMAKSFDSLTSNVGDLPLAQGLELYFESAKRWAEENPAFAALLAKTAYQGDAKLSREIVAPVASAMRETVEELLRQARTRGELRKDVDIPATARLIHALTLCSSDPVRLPYLNAYFQVTSDDVKPNRMREALFKLITEGLAGQPVVTEASYAPSWAGKKKESMR